MEHEAIAAWNGRIIRSGDLGLHAGPTAAQAYADAARHGIGTGMYRAYCTQARGAHQRGIGWHFTLEEWSTW